MRAERLLVLSSRAGGLNSEIESRLRQAFADHTVLRFGAVKRIQTLVTPTAKVVVAGGDGTVGAVVRRLAGTSCRIGVVPLGRVNGVVFLEACGVGLFGATIRLGEYAKDGRLRGITAKIRRVLTARPFRYELSKDLVASGTAMSLVFSNTSSTGFQLPVGDSTPADRYLDFSAQAGSTHLDIAGRALASALLAKHREEGADQVFKFRKVRVVTKPRVRAYADHVPAVYTPLTVSAELSRLKFIVPR